MSTTTFGSSRMLSIFLWNETAWQSNRLRVTDSSLQICSTNYCNLNNQKILRNQEELKKQKKKIIVSAVGWTIVELITREWSGGVNSREIKVWNDFTTLDMCSHIDMKFVLLWKFGEHSPSVAILNIHFYESKIS